MRIEYNFSLDEVETPTFSVESIEGPAKLFTLATTILNMLGPESKTRIDVVFHSPNQGDLPRKVDQFERILGSGPSSPAFRIEKGKAGSVGSSYYLWITVHSGD